MRQGDSPEEACHFAIARLRCTTFCIFAKCICEKGFSNIGVLRLLFLALLSNRQNCNEQNGIAKMHKKLTVGVAALSVHGEVGASSTLGPHNPHRGRNDFPCVVWREGIDEPTSPFPRVFGVEGKPN